MSRFGTFTSHRPIRNQTVTVGVASAAITNAIGEGIQIARLVSTSAAHYAIGAAPLATVADVLLPANVIEFVAVRPGEKVAFIQATAGGTAHVTEVSQ